MSFEDRVTEGCNHENNFILIQLYPLPNDVPIRDYVFYKIFGGVPPADYILACLESWLKNPNDETIRTCEGVYSEIAKNLGEIIE